MAASVWWKEKDSFDDEGIIFFFVNFTAIFSVSNDINRIRMQPWNLCISDIYTFYGQFFILFIWKFDCHWINEQHIGGISDVVMKSQGGAKLLKHAVVKARHAWDNESKVSKKGCWTEKANKMLYIFLICIAGIYRVLKSGRDVWIEMFTSYWKETLFHHIQSQWDCRCHEVFMPLCRGETSSAHHRTAPRQTGCDWIDSNRKMFFAVKPREGTLMFETQKSCCVFLLLQNLKAYEISNFQSQERSWLLGIHSWRSCARRRQLKTSHWQVTGPASDSAVFDLSRNRCENWEAFKHVR